jgi:hypothetical protein
MTNEAYEKEVRKSKEILYDYKHNIGDVYTQLSSACKELGLPVEGMTERWEKSSIFDLDKFEGIFFILTGKKYSKEAPTSPVGIE